MCFVYVSRNVTDNGRCLLLCHKRFFQLTFWAARIESILSDKNILFFHLDCRKRESLWQRRVTRKRTATLLQEQSINKIIYETTCCPSKGISVVSNDLLMSFSDSRAKSVSEPPSGNDHHHQRSREGHPHSILSSDHYSLLEMHHRDRKEIEKRELKWEGDCLTAKR